MIATGSRGLVAGRLLARPLPRRPAAVVATAARAAVTALAAVAALAALATLATTARAQQPPRAGEPAASEALAAREPPAARRLLPEDSLLPGTAPHVAAGNDGTVAVAFAVDDVLRCAVSRDGGRTFGAPAVVGQAGRLERGVARGPQVAVAGGTLVVTAVCGEQLMGKDGDLLAYRSADHGASWEGPVRVNDLKDAAREGLHALAAAPDGALLAVWLDLRGDGTELWGSWSTDVGASWGANVRLYASPEGSICECCQPAVAFDPARGDAAVLWRNKLAGNRDMYVLPVPRAPGAAGAPSSRRLDQQHWPLQACPMAGGALAVSRTGELLAFWRRDAALFAARMEPEAPASAPVSGPAEMRLGEGRQTAVAAGPDGFHLVWIDPEGAVMAMRMPGGIGDTGTTGDSHETDGWGAVAPRKLGKGLNASVAGAPDGLGPVAAVWESGESGSGNLRFVVLADRRAGSGR